MFVIARKDDGAQFFAHFSNNTILWLLAILQLFVATTFNILWPSFLLNCDFLQIFEELGLEYRQPEDRENPLW